MLIALEGLDGSGKTTQAGLLKRRLRAMGRNALVSHWNASPLLHKAIVKAKRGLRLRGLTYSLLHAADFAETYAHDILPALDAGTDVLADRYTTTALVRDPLRGVAQAYVRQVYGFAREPDLCIYIDVAPQTALARIKDEKGAPAPYEAGLDLYSIADPDASFLAYQGECRAAYQSLAKADGYATVDGEPDERTVAAAVWAAVAPLLKPTAKAKPLAS